MRPAPTLRAWYWKGPSAACCIAASRLCISLRSRRASPTFTPAAAASLIALDKWAVPTPSLRAKTRGCREGCRAGVKGERREG